MSVPGIGKFMLPPAGFEQLLEKPYLAPRAGKAEPPPLSGFAKGYGPGRPANTAAAATSFTPGVGRSQLPSPQISDPNDPLWKAAQEFEAMMLSQMFEHMFSGIKSEGMFGGGHAERTYRTFLMQSYGESVAESGGVGIAESIYRDIAQAYRQPNEEV